MVTGVHTGDVTTQSCTHTLYHLPVLPLYYYVRYTHWGNELRVLSLSSFWNFCESIIISKLSFFFFKEKGKKYFKPITLHPAKISFKNDDKIVIFRLNKVF